MGYIREVLRRVAPLFSIARGRESAAGASKPRAIVNMIFSPGKMLFFFFDFKKSPFKNFLLFIVFFPGKRTQCATTEAVVREAQRDGERVARLMSKMTRKKADIDSLPRWRACATSGRRAGLFEVFFARR